MEGISVNVAVWKMSVFGVEKGWYGIVGGKTCTHQCHRLSSQYTLGESRENSPK
jgi:hypothetical protein